ncbi:hypothetical protein ACFWA6_20270 [Streptomyces sp. NPDC060020]|uniref:effector-associated constant component EACC1 n=1 Tax=Streptomyces sp. NPDC060020 TaxID=3347038 RepID=UPI0036A4A43D
MGHVIRMTLAGGTRAPESLCRFLVQDRTLRAWGRARWEPAAPAPEEQLGTGLDVLTLAVTAVLALPAAIDTVRRWCSSPGQGNTRVELHAGDVTVQVTGTTTPEEAAAYATALAAALQTVSPDPADADSADEPQDGQTPSG